MLVYSQACAYAVRALLRLARETAAKPLRARQIALEENIPYPFLAKVLQQLVRAGILTSATGPRGGFRLRVPASRIALLQVVKAVDGVSHLESCLMGRRRCNARPPCPMHESWRALRAQIMDYLRSTVVGEIAQRAGSQAVNSKALVNGTPAGRHLVVSGGQHSALQAVRYPRN